jgi:hypothetical protein
MLYLVTDVLLLAGITGIWWRRRRSLGPAGHAGEAIFVAGTLTIRVSAFGILGVAGYQLGAAIALVGLAGSSVETQIRRGASLCPPVLWLVSLACGVAAALGVAPPTLIGAAGVIFGVGVRHGRGRGSAGRPLTGQAVPGSARGSVRAA